MEHIYRKINDHKERLSIVLESLQPSIHKAELCRKEGIYTQQLVRWTQEALKGAEAALKKRPGRTKQHDPEKEYQKQEISYLKELLLEQTKEISVLKKRPIPYKKISFGNNLRARNFNN